MESTTGIYASRVRPAGRQQEMPGPFAAVRLLGASAFMIGGRSRKLPGKAFVLLAILALSPARCESRAKLRGILWGNNRHAHAAANLRQLLSRIGRIERSVGCRLLATDGETIGFASSDLTVDLTAFAPHALREAATDATRLAAVVRTYAGDLLADYHVGPKDEALDEWLTRERAELRSAFISAAVTLLQAGTCQPADELDVAARLLMVDPTHEAGHRARIRAYGLRGDISRSRASFRDCQRILMEELGVEPSAETMALANRFFDPKIRPPSVLEPRPPIKIPANSDTGRPRVAILPPVHPFDDRRLRELCAFLLEDLTIGLSSFRSFRVIAAHTAVAMASGAARGMNARDWSEYVVASALTASGAGLELKFRVTDARSNEVIWGSSIPFENLELPAVFSALAERAVVALGDSVEQKEIERPVPAEDKSAYRLFLEGRRYASSTALQEVRRARRLFRESARRDPEFAGARAGLARTQSMEWLIRGAPDASFLHEAIAEADEAILCDDHDARGYREKAYALLYLKRHDESLAFFSEAAKRNPNDADLLADYADALAHSGDPRSALSVLDRAVLLNPVPSAMYRWIRGSIHYQTGRFHDAIACLRPGRTDPATARLLAACHAQVGEDATARAYVRLSRQALPDFSTDDLWTIVPNRNSADTQKYIDGLKRAGFM